MKIAEFKGISFSFGASPKFVLWLQGCHRNCPGCLAPEWHNLDGGTEKRVDEIIAAISTFDVEGVVISGGEPLLQYQELLDLLQELKDLDKGVIIYTGYTEDVLKNEFPHLLSFCDLIVAGEYLEKLNPGSGLRGSTNQTVTLLTERYASEEENFLNGKRVIEITQDKEGTLICGVPPFDINLLFKKRVDVSIKKVH